MNREAATVSPSAEIEQGATIGSGSAVWQFSKVRRGATIGDRCRIGGGVYVGAGVTVGDDCKVENGAQLFEGARLADGVFVGPGALLLNDQYPRAITPAGAVKEADDWTVAGVTVDRGASIGGGATVLPGRRIGTFSLVGAGSVVVHDVPPHALVVGNPARRIGTVCACGTPVSVDSTCEGCGLTFRRDPASGFPEVTR